MNGEIAQYLADHREAEKAVRRTLSYVDGVSFARRASAPAHFGIGLCDTVCPPSTGFAAYNQYGAATGRPTPARETHTHPFNGHEGGEASHTPAAAAVARRGARVVAGGSGRRRVGPALTAPR
ncbi:acetylxylan esterase [Micromonospora coxensis]|uniref:acetylxylan esterase n=1 Tax=Micromonospora coxensis TaxID=356852 RepID=UPI0022B2658B|nr:acetylxylan esterase [Micromonospora coxensis]